MNLSLLAQTSNSDAAVAATVRSLVRGGLGIAPGSTATVWLSLFVWLAVLAGISCLLQRDRRRWLQGLVDIRGHIEHLTVGLDILRRNKRPLWILLAAAVFSWTGWSLATWQDGSSKDQLEGMLAVFDNSAASFAVAHSINASIVPFRSLVNLADSWPLVAGACVLLFARTGQIARDLRSKTRVAENLILRRRLGTIWVWLIILAAYRAVVFFVAPETAPVADCFFLNALIYPVVLLAADSILFSWVLAEYGRGLRGQFDWASDDTVAFVRTIPVSAVVCVLVNSGRYVLVACALVQAQFSTAPWSASQWTTILMTCTALQVFGLSWFALPGVIVARRGIGIVGYFHEAYELMRRAGGKAVGLTILSVAFNFLGTLPFYWIFGAMQRETWSLLGAASYANYVSLMVGIIMLSGSAQLASSELGIVDAQEPAALPTLLVPAVPFTPQ